MQAKMSKGRVFNMLRLVGCIVVMVTIFILFFVNLQFNLTGYVPLPVSRTFENLKAAYRGSFYKRTTGNKTIPKLMRTLTDVTEGMRASIRQNIGVYNENITKSALDILWYNPPGWMNIHSQNDILRSKCAFQNCRMSTNKTNLQQNAAIIFTLTEQLSHVPPISKKERNPDQAWIFFYSESPVHHFRVAYRHNNWRNTMNWSMSYNMDADIFSPYGILQTKTEIVARNYSAIFYRKKKLVAWAVSHCGARSKRDEFVSELSSYGVEIDIYGQCNGNSHYNSSELKRLINSDYKFYLSFENSFCKDYVTEKFFAYYDLDTVLIVRGGLNYDMYLPNNTFINTAHFKSIKELAWYIKRVGSSEESYVNYLRQKERYTAKHIYQTPMTPCILCEKLNKLNESRKTFEDHVSYIHQETCWDPKDLTPKSPTWLNFVVPAAIFTFSLFIIFIILKYHYLTPLRKRCSNVC